MELVNDLLKIFNINHKEVNKINLLLSNIINKHNDSIKQITIILYFICNNYKKYAIYMKIFKKHEIFNENMFTIIIEYNVHDDYFKPLTNIGSDALKYKHNWNNDEMYNMYNNGKYLELMNILFFNKDHKNSNSKNITIYYEIIKKLIVNKLWNIFLNVLYYSKKLYYSEFIIGVRLYLLILPKRILYNILSVYDFTSFTKISYYINFYLNNMDKNLYIPFDNFPMKMNLLIYSTKVLFNDGYIKTSNNNLNRFIKILNKLPVELNILISNFFENKYIIHDNIINKNNIYPCITYILV